MEENSIYSSLTEGDTGRDWCGVGFWRWASGTLSSRVFWPAVDEFPVVVQRTEAAARCQLKGTYILRLSHEGIQLSPPGCTLALYSWPYHFLRKFGSYQVRGGSEPKHRTRVPSLVPSSDPG